MQNRIQSSVNNFQKTYYRYIGSKKTAEFQPSPNILGLQVNLIIFYFNYLWLDSKPHTLQCSRFVSYIRKKCQPQIQ